ncbi:MULTISPECIES: sigma-70 family RNA polymerase sigma factor [Sporomusa]|uniref:sigma-70 family RNA polymerase sigma factor n=1 Tax=Sporomusa TaxID=2375 RepID=UPI001665FEF2|nr:MULTISPECIES: sigma-70 family RNA polymerase sigma factor [Sporomusa]HML35642.1 sigma-70 family RNA polymerase sigma factor [Sporomusa sphaeroides]
MKIKYCFVTGETVEITVPEHMVTAILKNDMEIKNNNRRESNKHYSFDELQTKGMQLPDRQPVTTFYLEQQEMRKMLSKAVQALLPQQQWLLQQIFFEERSMTEIAREEGVTVSAISHRLELIYKKLKRLLLQNR